MYNESRKKSTIKYLKTQKQIRFWVSPDLYSQIQCAAEEAGFPSLRQFYLFAISELILKIKNGFKVSDCVDNEILSQEVVADGANIE